ncbi:hypothetical protein [Photobacterium damselae]|uniref:hypothetical protein n=1 Tax=Photobacterium damselae TaxID=38293 RepID=UPI004067C15D
MRSEFEAKVAVGLYDSAAVMMLEEHQITFDGNKVINGCDFAVKNDMEADSPSDWFHHLRPKGTAEDIGIYHVKGRVKFDEDSADYYSVKVTQIL